MRDVVPISDDVIGNSILAEFSFGHLPVGTLPRRCPSRL